MVEFLNGGLDNEWTDLFGHFNLELDEINPWTFLDTFRNLIFLSTFYQAARQSLHKMWLWIYKAQKLPPRCDILTGMWLLADKNWHASELYFGAIQKGLGNRWLLQHLGICFCIGYYNFYFSRRKAKWDQFGHDVRLACDTCQLSSHVKVRLRTWCRQHVIWWNTLKTANIFRTMAQRILITGQ